MFLQGGIVLAWIGDEMAFGRNGEVYSGVGNVCGLAMGVGEKDYMYKRRQY